MADFALVPAYYQNESTGGPLPFGQDSFGQSTFGQGIGLDDDGNPVPDFVVIGGEP